MTLKVGHSVVGHSVREQCANGKLCTQPVMVTHLRILLRGLGATRICAQGRQLSRVLLLLLLLAAVLRRRLWKTTHLFVMLHLAQPSHCPFGSCRI